MIKCCGTQSNQEAVSDDQIELGPSRFDMGLINSCGASAQLLSVHGIVQVTACTVVVISRYEGTTWYRTSVYGLQLVLV